MIRDPNSDYRRTRLILLLVGVFGLAGSAAIYFACMNSHPHTNEAIRPADTAPASAVAATQPRSFGITNVTIPDSTAVAGQANTPVSADVNGVAAGTGTTSDAEGAAAAVAAAKHNKHKLRANRNRIASRIPGMDRMPGPNFHSPLPPGQVEMWSGTKKSVVEVDPGTKFED